LACRWNKCRPIATPGSLGSIKGLEPARGVLTKQPYLAGDRPLYADYILFGSFMWARSISSFRVLTLDDPIYSWRERMLDAMGGLARNAPGHID
jgi:glutathione S-transferase